MNLERVVERAKEGDADALGSLYNAYADKMKGVCIKIIKGNKDDAEDLVHDAFIIAFASIGKLRNPERFGQWITTITTHLSLKYLEKSKSVRRIELSALKEEDIEIPEEGYKNENSISVHELLEMIEKLPEGYRTIFRLSVIEGLSHKEIADILGIEPHSSSSQLYRAKAILRKYLSDYRAITLIIIAILMLPIYKYCKRKQPYNSNRIKNSSEVCKEIKNEKNATQRNESGINSNVIKNQYMANKIETSHYNKEYNPPICNDTVQAICDSTDSHKSEAPKSKDIPIPEHYNKIDYDNIPIAHRHKKSKWNMLLAGSAGPALAQGVYKMISSNTSTSDAGNITTWEELYKDLATRTNEHSPADSIALMNIAKNNSGRIIENEKHEKPITIGLSLTKTLSDNWSFETGLQYSMLKSTFTMGSGSNNICKYQKVHYLGIPLRLSYRIIGYKRVSAYGSAGLLINIPLGGKINERLLTDSIPMDIGSDKVNVPLQWSLNASFGLQYKLTPNFSVYLEPTLNYYIPTGSSTHTIWTEHPFYVTMPFGIRFTW
jgi:RNA polymerase sigma factor (sigma-70 family)